MTDTNTDTSPNREKEHIEGPASAHDLWDSFALKLEDSRQELVGKIRWIIRTRFVVSISIVVMMLCTAWWGLTEDNVLTMQTLVATCITAGVAVVLNFAFILAMRHQRDLHGLVLIQLSTDVLIFTSYVYRTGGVTSPFTFLYLLPIIAGAMLVSTRVSFGLAGFASIAYGLLAFLESTGVIDHISYFVALDSFARKWSYVSLMTLVNPAGFLAVAGISSFLMRNVRARTMALHEATVKLDRKARLLQMLYEASRSATEGDAPYVIHAIGDILIKGLDLDRVLLYLVDTEKNELVLAREFFHPRLDQQQAREHLQVHIPLDARAGLTARCALERRPENVQDPRNHPHINQELATEIGLNPFALAPLVARDELLGVLGVDRSESFGVLSDDAFQLLIAFADQAAATLRGSRCEHGGTLLDTLRDMESTTGK